MLMQNKQLECPHCLGYALSGRVVTPSQAV